MALIQTPMNSAESTFENNTSAFPLPADPKLAEVERHVYVWGPHPDSYLITEPNYHHFWNQARTACVGFLIDGRFMHIIGGIIGPKNLRTVFLQELVKYADSEKKVLIFYCVTDEELPLYQALGFQPTRFGVSTNIALSAHSWQGKAYSWVRRQISFVKRHGYVYEEIDLASKTAAERAAIFQQLALINQDHFADRLVRHEIDLMEGKLYPDYFFRRRLFVARHEHNSEHWEAFVACTPMKNGSSWGTEMYRCRQNSIRGVIPYLLAAVIDQMKMEGAENVSLCMVPAIHCSEPLVDGSWLGRFLMVFWEKRLAFLFNSQGLYHFKTRFRPEEAPLYLCVRPQVTIWSSLSFIRCAGLHRINWWDFLKQLLFRKKRIPRTTTDD